MRYGLRHALFLLAWLCVSGPAVAVEQCAALEKRGCVSDPFVLKSGSDPIQCVSKDGKELTYYCPRKPTAPACAGTLEPKDDKVHVKANKGCANQELYVSFIPIGAITVGPLPPPTNVPLPEFQFCAVLVALPRSQHPPDQRKESARAAAAPAATSPSCTAEGPAAEGILSSIPLDRTKNYTFVFNPEPPEIPIPTTPTEKSPLRKVVIEADEGATIQYSDGRALASPHALNVRFDDPMVPDQKFVARAKPQDSPPPPPRGCTVGDFKCGWVVATGGASALSAASFIWFAVANDQANEAWAAHERAFSEGDEYRTASTWYYVKDARDERDLALALSLLSLAPLAGSIVGLVVDRPRGDDEKDGGSGAQPLKPSVALDVGPGRLFLSVEHAL